MLLSSLSDASLTVDLGWLFVAAFEALGETVVANSERDSTTDRGSDAFLTDPSHVCQSCGEEYYVDTELTIGTCRGCGGTKVQPP